MSAFHCKFSPAFALLAFVPQAHVRYTRVYNTKLAVLLMGFVAQFVNFKPDKEQKYFL